MKRKVKKLLSLTLLLSLGMAGCGNQKEDVPSSISNSTPSSEKESSEPANSSKPADSSKPEESSKPEDSSISASSPEISSKVDSSLPGTSSSVPEESSSLPPIKVEYDLTLTLAKGVEGHFEVDGAEATKAEKGKTVTIVISYDATKTRNITLTSGEVSLLKTDDTHYTFTMPERNVTVLVEGEHIPQSYKIASLKYLTTNFTQTDENYFLADSNTPKVKLKEGTEYVEGQTVTYNFRGSSYSLPADSDPKQIFQLGLYVNGTLHMFALNADSTDSGVVIGTVSFVMPSEDVNLVVSRIVKEAKEGETDTVTVHFDVDPGYTVYRLRDGGVYSRSTVKDSAFAFDLDKDYGYSTPEVTYTSNESSEAKKITYSSYSGYKISSLSSSITEINYRIKGEYRGYVNAILDGGLDGFTTDSDLHLLIGEQSELEFKNGDKRITAIKAKDSHGQDFEIDAKENYSHTSWTVSLTPTAESGDITLYFTLSNSVTLTYETNPAIESVTFKDGSTWNSKILTKAFPGDDVYVEIKLKDGYRLNKGYYTKGENDEISQVYGSMYFTVPSDTSTLYIHFDISKLYTYTLTNRNDDLYTFSMQGFNNTYFAKGDKVSFKVTPKIGYAIDSIDVKDKDGNPVTLSTSETLSGQYYFQMPESDVNITVNGHTIQTSKVTFNMGKDIQTFTLRDSNYNRYESGDAVNPGTQLNLDIKPKFGYQLTEIKVGNTVLTPIQEGSSRYSFVAPDSDFEITYTTIQNPTQKVTVNSSIEGALKFYKLSDQKGSTDLYDSSKPDQYSIEDSKAYVGDKTRVTISSDSDLYFWDDKNTKVLDSDGHEVTFTVTKTSYSSYLEFTMPDKEITVTIAFQTVNNKNITYNMNNTNVHQISAPSKAQVGSETTFELYLSSYNFDNTRYQISIKTVSGKEITFIQYDYSDEDTIYEGNIMGANDITVKFTMPDEDVIVTITDLKAESVK